VVGLEINVEEIKCVFICRHQNRAQDCTIHRAAASTAKFRHLGTTPVSQNTFIMAWQDASS